MKAEIHPEYHTFTATCSCGNKMEVGSTLAEDLHLDVCSSCHPFYTGKQKTIDSGGRVEKFRQRWPRHQFRQRIAVLIRAVAGLENAHCRPRRQTDLEPSQEGLAKRVDEKPDE